MSKIFINIIFCAFVLGESIAQVKEEIHKDELHLSVIGDTIANKIHFYLSVNDTLTDSTFIDVYTFYSDTLIAVNDSVWHYIYSINEELYYQVLIEEFHRKVHFSYISLHLHKSPLDDNELYDHYLYSKKYELNIWDSLKAPHVGYTEYMKLVENGVTKIDSIGAISYLIYDSEKRIYYNSIETLNGTYSLSPIRKKGIKRKPENVKKIDFENEEVLSLKFENSCYVYINGNWFAMVEKLLYLFH